MKLTQLQFVKNRLTVNGSISRNECLSHQITRLSAIMLTLKHEGFIFSTERRGGDYVYVLKDKPPNPRLEQSRLMESKLAVYD